MLRLSPPGFERFFQSPVLAGDLRRRRSQRGREPGAVRPRQLLRDARAGQPDRRRRRAGASRRRRADRLRPARRRRGSASTSPKPAPASAPRPWSTTGRARRVGDVKPGDVAVGRGVRRRGMVPRDRHHAGARPGRGRRARARPSARRGPPARASASISTTARSCGARTRAREVMRPLASMADVLIANEEDIQACLGLEVHGADVAGGRLDLAGYRDVAERVVREFGVEAGGHHAARELLGEPQRLERGALRRRRRASSTRASATTSRWSIGLAAATVSLPG